MSQPISHQTKIKYSGAMTDLFGQLSIMAYRPVVPRTFIAKHPVANCFFEALRSLEIIEQDLTQSTDETLYLRRIDGKSEPQVDELVAEIQKFGARPVEQTLPVNPPKVQTRPAKRTHPVINGARKAGHSVTTADQILVKHNETTPAAVRKEVVLDSVLNRLVDPVLPAGTHLYSLVGKYEQKPDEIGGLEESNVLILEMADQGKGGILIVKTDRWACNINELQTVLIDFQNRTQGLGYGPIAK